MSDHGYPPLEHQYCLNCRYSRFADEEEGLRLCSRHAPRVLDSLVNIDDHQALGIWPTVMNEDWCGEWGPGEDPFVLGGGA
jgi:hypothetical protein